jgi:hypothetical protein
MTEAPIKAGTLVRADFRIRRLGAFDRMPDSNHWSVTKKLSALRLSPLRNCVDVAMGLGSI